MMNEDDPLVQRAVTLLARSVLARDDECAGRLAAAHGNAVVDAGYASWGRKIDAAKLLLAQAELALDAAEVATEPHERRRQLGLFELLMACAEVLKAGSRGPVPTQNGKAPARNVDGLNGSS
jgi:hypothetical protein